jgi:hypothetical protein
MVFDHAGVIPNPARDPIRVKLPREDRPEISPPTHEHVVAVHGLLSTAHRLPLIVLDGDRYACRRGRAADVGRCQRAARPVARLAGRLEDPARPVGKRTPGGVRGGARAMPARRPIPRSTGLRRLFRGPVPDGDQPRLRRGVPVFSSHDLRHRRISLMHLAGIPWARIGEHVGQRDLAVTTNTYTHVLIDETELDYVTLLSARVVLRSSGPRG